MNKTGRNDPCPGGAGVKFKKCLAKHSGLSLASSPAEIWWVCDRWDAPVPPLDDLRSGLVGTSAPLPEKFKPFLESVFGAPVETIPWRRILADSHAKGHPDVPGLFRRISAHLSGASDSQLPMFIAEATALLREAHPEMYSEFLAATLALDPAVTPSETLEGIVDWACAQELPEDCDRLRERFPGFPEYIIYEEIEEDGPDESANGADEEGEPEVPSAVDRELDRIWDEFNAIESPTAEETEAFVDALLAQPHEASNWADMLEAVRHVEHLDIFRILDRATSVLSHSRSKGLASVYWGMMEEAVRRNEPERLPGIARGFQRLDASTYDVDALSHIRDALLDCHFIDECLELMDHFIPILRADDGLMPWAAPRMEMETLQLRLGKLIASGAYADEPVDRLVGGLFAGMEGEFDEDWASAVLQSLARSGESSFSRDQFQLPGAERDPDKKGALWVNIQKAFAELARDGWGEAADEHPALILAGLHMVLRAAEDWLDSPRQKGKKYPTNLLDYLHPSVVERQVTRECADLIGISRQQARIMLNSCAAMARWAEHKGLLDERESAESVGKAARLLDLLN